MSDVVAISDGIPDLALRSDGTVVAWVWGGQVDAGLSRVTGVAAGTGHSLALRSDGTVAAWGDDRYGQADVPAGLGGVVAVAAGFGHSLALVGSVHAQLAHLLAVVQAEGTGLAPRLRRNLAAEASAAQRFWDAGAPSTACGQLAAFANGLDAQSGRQAPVAPSPSPRPERIE